MNYIKLGKERLCHLTKQLMHSFSVNIRISQTSKVMFTVVGLKNPVVNLKRMHLLYNVVGANWKHLYKQLPITTITKWFNSFLFGWIFQAG